LKQIHIKLPELLHRELRIQAAIREQTLQDYVIEAIQNKIALDKSSVDLVYAIEEPTSDKNTE
jgi:hypothetical protein